MVFRPRRQHRTPQYWVVAGGIPGGGEHGMGVKHAGERGRSRGLCEGVQYRRTSLGGEDVERVIGKSDGS
jgi:hypothetical protein